ncbi:Protein hgh1 [Neophaeococcomyces mojaviensis]|uniref:Protein hgh1 n=1 Tax=Neophaeococcomyces mojaviensis TaxID=3383035 RepID=A0ACC2ZSM0_9EURO|nr:Protein hgh1 [Knufia sp. JES_112]
MPSELEELIEFLHHGNTQIRQVATNHLVGYSTAHDHISTLFKRNQLEPLKDLKLLVRDYTPIAHDALTILTNLTGSGDREVLQYFARDEVFVEVLLTKIVDVREENADLCCGLLANLVKDDQLAERLVKAERDVPPRMKVKVKLKSDAKGRVGTQEIGEPVEMQVSTSKRVLDQLMDVFVKGANGSLNQHANYDYISYVFADLSKFKDGQKYLLERQGYDGVVPITKLMVFTDPDTGSLVRRKGIAGVIKNVTFEVSQHPYLMRHEAEGGVGLLPYILLPLAGSEEFDAEDSEGMLDELQLLPPDKDREPDDEVVVAYIETLLLLTTTKEGRDVLRRVKVYPVIRELHLKREGDNVREGCERLVDVLMRDEEKQDEVDDGDHKIEEIF